MEYHAEKDNSYQGTYMHDFTYFAPGSLNYYLTVDNLLNDKDFTVYQFDCKEIPYFHENIEAINHFLSEQLYLNKLIIVYIKEIQVKNFRKELKVSSIITDEENLEKGKVNIILKEMNQGFMYDDKVVLTSKELFSYQSVRKKYKTHFKYASKIKDLNKLEVGDYVVHAVNGIGIY